MSLLCEGATAAPPMLLRMLFLNIDSGGPRQMDGVGVMVTMVNEAETKKNNDTCQINGCGPVQEVLESASGMHVKDFPNHFFKISKQALLDQWHKTKLQTTICIHSHVSRI